MTLKQEKPFTRQHLEKKADTFTVRCNKEERAMLEEMKDCLNIPYDSKALKICGRVGLNVLLAQFGKRGLKYLFSGDRSKLEDFKELGKQGF